MTGVQTCALPISTVNTGTNYITAGYSEANATADIQIGSTPLGSDAEDIQITAVGSVTIRTNATSIADIAARTNGDLGDYPENTQDILVAFAVAVTDLQSQVMIEQQVIITANGNINIYALGTSKNNALADSGLYENGIFAPAIALSFKKGNVLAQINGTLQATGEEVDTSAEPELTKGIGILALLNTQDSATSLAARDTTGVNIITSYGDATMGSLQFSKIMAYLIGIIVNNDSVEDYLDKQIGRAHV